MSVYDSERVAAAYAFDRPPVHERILRSVRLGRGAQRALDVGCGAEDYLRYTVGGINVDRPEEAREWCRETLAPLFAAGDVTVIIPGYVATLSRTETG